MHVLDLKVDDHLLYKVRDDSLREIVYFARSLVRYYARINKDRNNKYKCICAYIYDAETVKIYYTIGSIFADGRYSMLRVSDLTYIVIRGHNYG